MLQSYQERANYKKSYVFTFFSSIHMEAPFAKTKRVILTRQSASVGGGPGLWEAHIAETWDTKNSRSTNLEKHTRNSGNLSQAGPTLLGMSKLTKNEHILIYMYEY